MPSVGDSLRDLQASAAVGCQPILVLTGKGKKTQAAGGLPENTRVYEDLAAAVRAIIRMMPSAIAALGLFFLLQSALTVVWSLLSLLTFPLPPADALPHHHRLVAHGDLAGPRALRHRYEVRGLEHLPGSPASSWPSTSRRGRRSRSRCFCRRRSG